MFRKLNLFLKVDIYNEPNFFVKKIDDTHYMIGSSNGLRSFVTFHDRIMFVKVLQTDDSLASRYCTPMNDVNMSYADFVIMQAKKTIHLHIQKKYIYNFVFFNFNSFLNKKSSQSEIYHDFEGVDYKEVEFFRKKVIKNIDKFQFKQQDEKHSYYIFDKLLFEVSNYHNYFRHILKSKKNNSTIEKLLGGSGEHFSQHINLSQIPLLKIDNEFCTFVRKKNLNIHYVTQAKIINFGYLSGKLNFGEVNASSTSVMRYHLNILEMVDNKFNKLRLTKPSEHIITTLTELGLSTRLPLSNDDLMILDMYKI